jgi:hypothetical protein
MSRLVQRFIAARIIMAGRMYVNCMALRAVDVIRIGTSAPVLPPLPSGERARVRGIYTNNLLPSPPPSPWKGEGVKRGEA